MGEGIPRVIWAGIWKCFPANSKLRRNHDGNEEYGNGENERRKPNLTPHERLVRGASHP